MRSVEYGGPSSNGAAPVRPPQPAAMWRVTNETLRTLHVHGSNGFCLALRRLDPKTVSDGTVKELALDRWSDMILLEEIEPDRRRGPSPYLGWAVVIYGLLLLLSFVGVIADGVSWLL